MKLYRYYGYMNCDCIVGICKANSEDEAIQYLHSTYSDYKYWASKELEEIDFDENNVCEIYYGGC